MNNESSRQERILKIFTPVRCMNRDQLLRYERGQMTAVEKHLVEQHIVDCDLCHDAVLALENPKNHEPFERLSQQLNLFIQREYAAPVKQQKQQVRPARQVMSRESLLSYFWVIMFVVIGSGSVFLLQQHLKNRPALNIMPARAADALVIPRPAVSVSEETPAAQPPLPVIQTQYGTRDTTAHRHTAALSARDSALLKKKPPRDSARKAVADSNARVALKAPQPPVAKDTPKPKEKLPVATTPIQQEQAKVEQQTPPEEEEKKEEAPKPAAPAVSGDEALYRSAMQNQQQGDVNEAINQFKKLSGNDRYSERAKYQLALLYRSKGQNGKARRLFREIVKMDGNLKSQAQAALDMN